MTVGEALRRAADKVPERQTDRREKHLILPKEQTQIMLGHLGVTRRNPDYVPLEVLDMILAAGGPAFADPQTATTIMPLASRRRTVIVNAFRRFPGCPAARSRYIRPS